MRLRVEFDAEWQPGKIAIVTNQLRRFLAECRGVGRIDTIQIVPVEQASKTPTAPALLPLYCTNKSFGKACGAVWQAETFTPCPQCGQKKYVHKGVPITDEEVEKVYS